MKNFNVTITLYIPITACNEEQAQERADMIQEWLSIKPTTTAKWLGDQDCEVTVEEE